MKAYRYTVKGRGIFISLKLLDEKKNYMLPDELDDFYDAETRFNTDLECPPIYKGYRNWFTEAGCKEFKEELDKLLYLYRKYGFEPKEEIREIADISEAKYADVYQMLLPA